MSSKVIILTGNNHFFGQTRKPWVSLNVDLMKSLLERSGFSVEVYTFDEIINKNIELENSVILYTFSQKPEIRRYIDDIISHLHFKGNKMIPNPDFHRCHENKGFQELYKRKLGIKSLNAKYFSNSNDIEHYEFNYPIVLKTVDGSNGNGVFLIQNKEELLKKIRKYEKINFPDKLDLFRRKFLRKEKKYKEYPDYNNTKDYQQYKEYITPCKRFVLQDFIPNLQFDFRVLVVYDHFYITKRHVRDNDFRASGAKKFDFNFQADPKVLDFASGIFAKMDNPYISLDIAFDGKECYLLEFQALHFGINVLVKSSGYYFKSADKWSFHHKQPEIESDLTHGLIEYLKK